jgi:ribosome-binding factor A
LAKVYLSLFPTKDKEQILEGINKASREIRGLLGRRVRHQLRAIPELRFYLDDSLDYIEKIDKLLKNQ